MARQRLRPLKNTALHEAITSAGWTLAATAQAVNTVGAENNIPMTYGPTSVSHWLAGVTPRTETVPVVVEAFARALDRPSLRAGDLGWDNYPMTEAMPCPWVGDPVARITQLARSDMDRRGVLKNSLYSIAALAVPTEPTCFLRCPGPTRRAGAGDVARIRRTTQQFADLDDLYGGGHARTAVAAYLTADVVPLLQGTSGRTRPDLFRAASELAYLAGYMAADAGANGLGQRYFVESVRLADEADDTLLRATALRSMTVQAIELGHASHAVGLAEAAVNSISNGCPARTRAWVTGAHAEALAAAADGHGARQMLRRAERDLERADSLPESTWHGGYRRESFEHQAGTLLASLGDLAGAEAHLAASVTSRRTVENRTRALVGVRLARVQCRRGDHDAAKATLCELREELAGVESARVRRELAALPKAVLPTS